MKKIATTLALVLVAGCSTKPLAVISPTTLPMDAAFDCAFRQLNVLGYTVTSTDKAAGYIYAEKQTRSKSLGVLGGNASYDRLTVAIYDADSTLHKIRVIASSEKEAHSLVGVQLSPRRPSDQVKADADALLAACEKGAVPTGKAGRGPGPSNR
jgi:hypothetical protein